MEIAFVQELGYKETQFGRCLYLKIRRYDDKPMTWLSTATPANGPCSFFHRPAI